MIHDLHDLAQLLVPLQLRPLEIKIVAHLPQANRAQRKRFLIRLIQLRRTVHETFVGLTMPHRKNMTQLVAGRLDRSVLHELGHLGVEHPGGLSGVLGEVRVVPRVTLDADPPALLCHAEHECPTVLWIEVGVGEHEQALILLELHIILKVLKYLPSVELLDAGVGADAGLDDASPLQFRQILLDVLVLLFLWLGGGDLAAGPVNSSLALHSQHRHAREKEFEDSVHIVNEHLLERVLLLSCELNLRLLDLEAALSLQRVGHLTLFVPHLEDNDLINGPILLMLFEAL